MPVRFSVFGFKGGVGKSVLAYYLAKELAKNYKVLLIDRDTTNTIGKLFDLEVGLINYLEGEEGKFITERGNLRVLSLVSFYPSKLPSVEKFASLYSNVLKDIDVIVTDNPPGLDDITNLEYQGYYLTMNEVHCNAIVVTTPGIALSLILQFMDQIPSILGQYVRLSSNKLIALIINMVRDPITLPSLPLLL